MDFSAVNNGVVDYLTEAGAGQGPACLSSTGAQDVLQAVVGLVRESLSVPAHWNTTSPVVGAVIMKREMKRRHAELDEAALEALARNFASAWALTRPMVHS